MKGHIRFIFLILLWISIPSMPVSPKSILVYCPFHLTSISSQKSPNFYGVLWCLWCPAPTCQTGTKQYAILFLPVFLMIHGLTTNDGTYIAKVFITAEVTYQCLNLSMACGVFS